MRAPANTTAPVQITSPSATASGPGESRGARERAESTGAFPSTAPSSTMQPAPSSTRPWMVTLAPSATSAASFASGLSARPGARSDGTGGAGPSASATARPNSLDRAPEGLGQLPRSAAPHRLELLHERLGLQSEFVHLGLASLGPPAIVVDGQAQVGHLVLDQIEVMAQRDRLARLRRVDALQILARDPGLVL